MDIDTLKTMVNGLGLCLDIAGVIVMFQKTDVAQYFFGEQE